MLIAQISDLHIMPPGKLMSGRVDTAPFLERAVAHILALDPRPDLVLITGDLVDAGKSEEYARLRAMLAPLPMPVFVIPGNHDAREALRAAFPEQEKRLDGAFVQYVVDGYPLRLIALDTLVPGAPHGELCDARLDWLEQRLAETDRPAIIFMHHPPFDCGIEEFDTASLMQGRERLAEILHRNPRVERVLCGHVHRPIQARFGGTIASVGLSTAHQATLDLRPGVEISFTMDPPAIALHQWRQGILVTHLSFIGDFDGPHPFD